MPDHPHTTGLAHVIRILRRLMAYNLAAIFCLLSIVWATNGIWSIRPVGITVMFGLLIITITLFNSQECKCRG